MQSKSHHPRPFRAALYLVLVGVCAALHIWKLPPALPVLQSEFGIDLIGSGFLLSIIQLAGMTLGLLVGLMAERIGLRRCIMAGLALLATGSVLATGAPDTGILMLLRAIEGCGFLMVAMPIPPLIRHLVPPSLLSRIMGLWSCYIPIGTILSLMFSSWMLSVSTWQLLWLVLSILTVAALLLTWLTIPADRTPRGTRVSGKSQPSAREMVRQTLSSTSVWLVALTFGAYSAQWMAVVGFLPTIYLSAGISGVMAGILTGLVAGANIIGNLAAGQLLHRQVPAHRLLLFGFTVMALCAFLAFGTGLPFKAQFLTVAVFSAAGGLIPATMFVLALSVAPSSHTTATTVGWMQQGSSFGQFIGPPTIAGVVSMAGAWEFTWVATSTFAFIGVMLALQLNRNLNTAPIRALQP